MFVGKKYNLTRFRCLFYVSILCSSIQLLPLNSKTIDNRQQLELVQRSIDAKENSIEQQQKKYFLLLNQLKKQQQSILHTSIYLNHIRSILKNYKHDINSLKYSILKLYNRQIKQQKLLIYQLDATFHEMNHLKLHLILSNNERVRGECILIYLKYLSKTYKETIDNLRKMQMSMVAKKYNKQKKQEELQQVLQQQQKQQQVLQNSYTACQKTLRYLNLSIIQNKQYLTTLYQKKKQLYYSIKNTLKKHKIYKIQKAHISLKRNIHIKVYDKTYLLNKRKRNLITYNGLGNPSRQNFWPIQGRTLHQFGETEQGELRYKGLIIAAFKDHKVKAIAAGQVLMADWLQGYGLMIIIEHGKGDLSLYGYNQKTLVTVGQQVKAEQPIAIVGTMNYKKTPLLYFEIRRHGQAVNPLPWLRK